MAVKKEVNVDLSKYVCGISRSDAPSRNVDIDFKALHMRLRCIIAPRVADPAKMGYHNPGL
ncbi:hypothetical protein LB505_011444 [Fusarium chuoi]|nr:hypothetical protein LB505_011444 [Fusarium chuoi]